MCGAKKINTYSPCFPQKCIRKKCTRVVDPTDYYCLPRKKGSVSALTNIENFLIPLPFLLRVIYTPYLSVFHRRGSNPPTSTQPGAEEDPTKRLAASDKICRLTRRLLHAFPILPYLPAVPYAGKRGCSHFFSLFLRFPEFFLPLRSGLRKSERMDRKEFSRVASSLKEKNFDYFFPLSLMTSVLAPNFGSRHKNQYQIEAHLVQLLARETTRAIPPCVFKNSPTSWFPRGNIGSVAVPGFLSHL